MSSIKVSDNIYWVGKVDDRKVPFHRLVLERGTTYNSYLIKSGKPTVIDTVDMMYGKEYIDNLSQVIDPETIEYIVINHVEPDHAGALPALAAKAKHAKIVSTVLGVKLLKDMFKLHNRDFIAVSDGDTLDIGGKVLQFYETPFLHTEETMVTYNMADKILFPCDQFSTHIATYDLFNDLVDENTYMEDFKVYYQLIMAPHRPYVRDMLSKIKNLDVQVIAPSHGFILRDKVSEFIRLYDEMSSIKENNKKVAVVYNTMTGNTAKVAQKLSEGLKEAGVEAFIYNLKNADLNELLSKVSECDGLLVGSSTKYGDMVGNTEEFLKALADNGNMNKPAAAFGSYGWSGEAIIYIEDYLNKAGFKVVNQKHLITALGVNAPLFPLRVNFTDEAELEVAESAGRVFGEQVLVNS